MQLIDGNIYKNVITGNLFKLKVNPSGNWSLEPYPVTGFRGLPIKDASGAEMKELIQKEYINVG